MRSFRLVALAVCLVGAAASCGRLGGADAAATTVEVFGPYTGVEADAFARSFAEFERHTGIDVRYTGSLDFAADLRERVASGVDAPDVALIPQPGLVDELAGAGVLTELDETTVGELRASVIAAAGGLDADVAAFAVPYRVSVKSLVWYRPEVLEGGGWTVPTTLRELEALVNEIEVASDLDPWCFSTFAGSSTGWAATDWVEDLLLRVGGPGTYAAWASGDVAFGDPLVLDAFERFESLVLDRGRTHGGLRSILETPVPEAPAPLFSDPPGCVLYKQASFATSWFPEGIEYGPDADVDMFALPGVSASTPPPIIIGGDLGVQFNAQPATSAFMSFLATPEAARGWADLGGYLGSGEADREDFDREVDWRIAELAISADQLWFDASDLMPSDIGSDLFWSEMTAWIAGAESLQDMTRTLDDARGSATSR